MLYLCFCESIRASFQTSAICRYCWVIQNIVYCWFDCLTDAFIDLCSFTTYHIDCSINSVILWYIFAILWFQSTLKYLNRLASPIIFKQINLLSHFTLLREIIQYKLDICNIFFARKCAKISDADIHNMLFFKNSFNELAKVVYLFI